MKLSLRNKSYEDSISLLKQILHEHPSIEVYTSAPITKEMFKKPNLEFSVNIIFNKAEDSKFAYNVDTILYYILVDYFARDEEQMNEEDYCTNVCISTINGSRNIAPYARHSIFTPYTLFKDGVYYN